jgi:RNA polymerase sigma-70 factor (ECF subfamily)
MMQDDDLVRAAQGGDRASFGEIYERYARLVHGVLLARIPVQEAEDLTQEVFVKALRRLSTLRERNKVGVWLAAIARNLANDYHRHSVATEELDGEGAESKARSASLDAGDAARVLGLIRSLPETYRETLILRLVEGMTGPEIAARTGLTSGSVRVNLHRGMQQLRAKLKGRNLSHEGEQL